MSSRSPALTAELIASFVVESIVLSVVALDTSLVSTFVIEYVVLSVESPAAKLVSVSFTRAR